MSTLAELVREDPLSLENSKTGREAVFEQLMSKSRNYHNDFYLARIFSSWVMGAGVLPVQVGLSSKNFYTLVTRHFSNHQAVDTVKDKPEFDRERIPEWEDLVGLMLEYRAGNDISERWIAEIVATACMGFDHLWQDLGLWCRGELSEVLSLNFPELAARNDKDMKWKKFLYKQLCERDGTYVCRAPSCDVCADYKMCFGPEE